MFQYPARAMLIYIYRCELHSRFSNTSFNSLYNFQFYITFLLRDHLVEPSVEVAIFTLMGSSVEQLLHLSYHCGILCSIFKTWDGMEKDQQQFWLESNWLGFFFNFLQLIHIQQAMKFLKQLKWNHIV